MNPSFGEWYRKAKIQPRSEDLLARVKAIEAFTKKIDEPKAAELVRYFVGISPKETTVTDAFTKELLATDAAFPTENNTVEMQVLCGAAIASILEQPSALADSAALMVNSAAAEGFKKPVILPDIIQLARSYLATRSEALRKIDTRRKFTVSKYEQLIDAVKNAAGTNSAQQLQQPLESLLKSMCDAINNVATLAEHASQVLERADAVLLEESNVIWWVFGGQSRDTGERFATLPPGFAAVLAGKELADLTRSPGPKAAPAYLDKQLDEHRNKKIKLTDLIEEISKDWLKELKPAKDFLDLAPVMFVLSNVNDGLDTPLAVQLAKRQLNVSSSAVDTLTIAMQVYTETLCLRTAGRK
jgi:GTPase-associated system helical domain